MLQKMNMKNKTTRSVSAFPGRSSGNEKRYKTTSRKEEPLENNNSTKNNYFFYYPKKNQSLIRNSSNDIRNTSTKNNIVTNSGCVLPFLQLVPNSNVNNTNNNHAPKIVSKESSNFHYFSRFLLKLFFLSLLTIFCGGSIVPQYLGRSRFLFVFDYRNYDNSLVFDRDITHSNYVNNDQRVSRGSGNYFENNSENYDSYGCHFDNCITLAGDDTLKNTNYVNTNSFREVIVPIVNETYSNCDSHYSHADKDEVNRIIRLGTVAGSGATTNHTSNNSYSRPKTTANAIGSSIFPFHFVSAAFVLEDSCINTGAAMIKARSATICTNTNSRYIAANQQHDEIIVPSTNTGRSITIAGRQEHNTTSAKIFPDAASLCSSSTSHAISSPATSAGNNIHAVSYRVFNYQSCILRDSQSTSEKLNSIISGSPIVRPPRYDVGDVVHKNATTNSLQQGSPGHPSPRHDYYSSAESCELFGPKKTIREEQAQQEIPPFYQEGPVIIAARNLIGQHLPEATPIIGAVAKTPIMRTSATPRMSSNPNTNRLSTGAAVNNQNYAAAFGTSAVTNNPCEATSYNNHAAPKIVQLNLMPEISCNTASERDCSYSPSGSAQPSWYTMNQNHRILSPEIIPGMQGAETVIVPANNNSTPLDFANNPPAVTADYISITERAGSTNPRGCPQGVSPRQLGSSLQGVSPRQPRSSLQGVSPRQSRSLQAVPTGKSRSLEVPPGQSRSLQVVSPRQSCSLQLPAGRQSGIRPTTSTPRRPTCYPSSTPERGRVLQRNSERVPSRFSGERRQDSCQQQDVALGKSGTQRAENARCAAEKIPPQNTRNREASLNSAAVAGLHAKERRQGSDHLQPKRTASITVKTSSQVSNPVVSSPIASPRLAAREILGSSTDAAVVNKRPGKAIVVSSTQIVNSNCTSTNMGTADIDKRQFRTAIVVHDDAIASVKSEFGRAISFDDGTSSTDVGTGETTATIATGDNKNDDHRCSNTGVVTRMREVHNGCDANSEQVFVRAGKVYDAELVKKQVAAMEWEVTAIEQEVGMSARGSRTSTLQRNNKGEWRRESEPGCGNATAWGIATAAHYQDAILRYQESLLKKRDGQEKGICMSNSELAGEGHSFRNYYGRRWEGDNHHGIDSGLVATKNNKIVDVFNGSTTSKIDSARFNNNTVAKEPGTKEREELAGTSSKCKALTPRFRALSREPGLPLKGTTRQLRRGSDATTVGAFRDVIGDFDIGGALKNDIGGAHKEKNDISLVERLEQPFADEFVELSTKNSEFFTKHSGLLLAVSECKALARAGRWEECLKACEEGMHYLLVSSSSLLEPELEEGALDNDIDIIRAGIALGIKKSDYYDATNHIEKLRLLEQDSDQLLYHGQRLRLSTLEDFVRKSLEELGIDYNSGESLVGGTVKNTTTSDSFGYKSTRYSAINADIRHADSPGCDFPEHAGKWLRLPTNGLLVCTLCFSKSFVHRVSNLLKGSTMSTQSCGISGNNTNSCHKDKRTFHNDGNTHGDFCRRRSKESTTSGKSSMSSAMDNSTPGSDYYYYSSEHDDDPTAREQQLLNDINIDGFRKANNDSALNSSKSKKDVTNGNDNYVNRVVTDGKSITNVKLYNKTAESINSSADFSVTRLFEDEFSQLVEDAKSALVQRYLDEYNSMSLLLVALENTEDDDKGDNYTGDNYYSFAQDKKNYYLTEALCYATRITELVPTWALGYYLKSKTELKWGLFHTCITTCHAGLAVAQAGTGTSCSYTTSEDPEQEKTGTKAGRSSCSTAASSNLLLSNEDHPFSDAKVSESFRYNNANGTNTTTLDLNHNDSGKTLTKELLEILALAMEARPHIRSKNSRSSSISIHQNLTSVASSSPMNSSTNITQSNSNNIVTGTVGNSSSSRGPSKSSCDGCQAESLRTRADLEILEVEERAAQACKERILAADYRINGRRSQPGKKNDQRSDKALVVAERRNSNSNIATTNNTTDYSSSGPASLGESKKSKSWTNYYVIGCDSSKQAPQGRTSHSSCTQEAGLLQRPNNNNNNNDRLEASSRTSASARMQASGCDCKKQLFVSPGTSKNGMSTVDAAIPRYYNVATVGKQNPSTICNTGVDNSNTNRSCRVPVIATINISGCNGDVTSAGTRSASSQCHASGITYTKKSCASSPAIDSARKNTNHNHHLAAIPETKNVPKLNRDNSSYSCARRGRLDITWSSCPPSVGTPRVQTPSGGVTPPVVGAPPVVVGKTPPPVVVDPPRKNNHSPRVNLRLWPARTLEGLFVLPSAPVQPSSSGDSSEIGNNYDPNSISSSELENTGKLDDGLKKQSLQKRMDGFESRWKAQSEQEDRVKTRFTLFSSSSNDVSKEGDNDGIPEQVVGARFVEQVGSRVEEVKRWSKEQGQLMSKLDFDRLALLPEESDDDRE